jgi:Tol biopolymer transport system component
LKLLLDKKDSVHNYLKLFPKNDKIIIKSEKIKNTSEGSISIMDPDGSNKKEVLGFTPELTDTIVLSPDGTKIAYFVSRNIKNSRPEYTLKVLDIESGKHLD